MIPDTQQKARTPTAIALAAGLLAGLASPYCQAESYAMIMSIGTYSNPAASLPGIDLDAATARKIAVSMGVKEANIIEYRDQQLSKAGMGQAFAELKNHIASGDNVFVYYSGHGTQRSGDAGRCFEGMVAHDMAAFEDADIEAALAELSSKAAQVVMLNDSCFSGGQATRKLLDVNRVAKVWKSSAIEGDYQCGVPINAKFARNLAPTAAKRGANLLYISAASENEVAFASAQGSSATVAWANCLQAGTDTDHSGMLTGRELQRCAQDYVTAHHYNQTITLIGSADLPLSFVGAAAAAGGSGTVAFAGAMDAGSAPANPLATLGNLRQNASPAIVVELSSALPAMKIGRDYLTLSVTSNTAGYLYLLNVGSDGQSFDLLFPNERDRDNFIPAGRVALPRPAWGIQAMGPVGTSHVMAIVSETPRQFGRDMTLSGGSPFPSAGATLAATRNLGVVAMGQGSAAPGRIGASQIIAISEIK